MPRLPITTDIFIERATNIHGNKYDYSMVAYINNSTKVKIICKLHGPFMQVPSSHWQGNGCPPCGLVKLSKFFSYTTETFISKAKKVHGNLFDYSQVNYKNDKNKVEIICVKHGSFLQIPSSHLQGHGCSRCAYDENIINFTKSLDEFITQANRIHSCGFDYSKSNYISDAVKLEIICKTHGSFRQTPSQHLQGHGCHKCTKFVSNPETAWLDSLNIPQEYRQKSIKVNGKNYRVDAFDPIANTAYEFNGDYWHGNPIKYNANDMNAKAKLTYGELYNKTIKKEAVLIEAGYKVISIWESDFKHK